MENISASELKPVLSTVGNRRDLGIPANANPPYINPPTLVVLDTPNNIYASPRAILTASHIQPGNSTAQISYHANDDGPRDTNVSVVFDFWWENSSPNLVLLTNIASHLTINGKWEVDAACYVLYPYTNLAGISSWARLRIVEFWSQPPSSPPYEGSQDSIVASIDVFGGWCPTSPPGHPSTNKREWVFNKSYGVKYSSLEVPAKGTAVFEVRLQTWTDIAGGPCIAEVDSSIVCPSLQFKVTEVIQKGPPLP